MVMDAITRTVKRMKNVKRISGTAALSFLLLGTALFAQQGTQKGGSSTEAFNMDGIKVIMTPADNELVSIIQQKYPGIPCMMISGRSAGQYVKRSLGAGARGYVLKDDFQDVLKGIQHVLEGGTYLSEQLIKEE